MKPFIIVIAFVLLGSVSYTQAGRWQQRAEYKMEIDFDAESHQFSGLQKLVYHNNSPDELSKVFYHLYFNAFQPGSMMDIRSQNIDDPDRRVGNRISQLKKNETGYHKITSLKQNGKEVKFEVAGTILEVSLNEPIAPSSSVVFDMEFESQVPVQIRRSGRNNAEGIAYSMSQWYPKLCEYDYQGWHANPYIAREFYGVWGDFDVKISIKRDYIIGATGYLQNPKEIGYGYEPEGTKVKGRRKKVTWHFFAPNVHDFVWTADPDYTHDTFKRKDGLVLHFFYQKNKKTKDNWAQLPKIMDRAFDFINERYGQYPYKKYSFIQGGDGGMEYPMATLIRGEGNLRGLVGVSVHELLHSWYQMLLGSNESLYAWMDEGFTSYASNEVMNFLRREKMIPGKVTANPHLRSYGGYFAIALSGKEEPMITHADHFETNFAYGRASYSKGAVFLHQLEYIIGKNALSDGLLSYFDSWKFKHPNSNDVIRVMEKESGLELDWYREYFINTTHRIDYGIKSVEQLGNNRTKVILERLEVMPMPIDLTISYADGNSELFNISLRIMRGNKPQEDENEKYTPAEDWPWTNPTYELIIPVSLKNIVKIEIDPSKRMADINRENNVFMQ